MKMQKITRLITGSFVKSVLFSLWFITNSSCMLGNKKKIYYDNGRQGDRRYYEELIEFKSVDINKTDLYNGSIRIKDGRNGMDIYISNPRGNDAFSNVDITCVKIYDMSINTKNIELRKVMKDGKIVFDASVCKIHGVQMERYKMNETDCNDPSNWVEKKCPNNGYIFPLDTITSISGYMGWKCPKCVSIYLNAHPKCERPR